MHLARLLFLAVAYLVGYGILFMTALLLLIQAVSYIIVILLLMREIIKRIDIDITEGLKLTFIWGFFGGLLLHSYHIAVLKQDKVSFMVFVFCLILFLIASPLLFSPVTRAYNKFIDENKKK
jgi:hypothetical protein